MTIACVETQHCLIFLPVGDRPYNQNIQLLIRPPHSGKEQEQ